MGVRTGCRAFLMHAPEDAVETIDLPELDRANRLSGSFDYLHLFVVTQSDLHQQFPLLKKHLKTTGMLWISWPKGGQKNTDLTLTKIIEIGYPYGLVESKTISLDTVWSAIKFTHPEPGKIYQNSYGQLKT